MKKLFYLLFIVTLLFSCDEIIMEDDISDKSVTLLAPANDAEFFSTGITFNWNPLEYVSEYRIQIALPDFENPLQIVIDQIIDTTSFSTQLNTGQYEWRVQAVNSGYSGLFATRAFTIISNEDFQNNSVALTSPANNLITNTASQYLSWESIIGAEQYQLLITDANGSTIIVDEQFPETGYSYSFPDGNFQWKVRASNGTVNTLYTSRSLLVDTTVPTTPVLDSPANESASSENTVVFQWSRVPIAGSTEKDSIYIYKNNTLTLLEYKNEQTSPYNMTNLANGTYYWYVKSFDEAGNISQQSSVYSFSLN